MTIKTNYTNNQTVFIVDDDNEICKALKWLLESAHLTVEMFTSPLQFLKNYNATQQGCILLDVRMTEMSGMQVLTELKIRNNTMPIIMITGHGDIPMAVRAVKMGASDFLTKPIDTQYLINQINLLMNNQIQCCSASDKNNAKKIICGLNDQERQVLDLMVNGRMNQQISAELGITTSAVELHRSHLMKKLNAKTLGELIKIYFTT